MAAGSFFEVLKFIYLEHSSSSGQFKLVKSRNLTSLHTIFNGFTADAIDGWKSE